MDKTTYHKTFKASLVFTIESDTPLFDIDAKRAVEIVNESWRNATLRIDGFFPELNLYQFEVGLFEDSDKEDSIVRVEDKLDQILELLK